VQADLEEGCQSEDDAQQADAAGKVQQPFPLGEGADAEHGDRDGEQGFCHIELIIEEIEVVVLFGEAFSLRLYIVLFFFVAGDGGLVFFYNRIAAGLFLDPDELKGILRIGLLCAFGLEIGPCIDGVGLCLVHGLDDVAVLDIADGHKGGGDGYKKGDQGVDPAFACVFQIILDRVRDVGHMIKILVYLAFFEPYDDASAGRQMDGEGIVPINEFILN